MEFTTIKLIFKDDIAIITLNRPKYANALNVTMGIELYEAALECTRRGLRAVVLTAVGNIFCMGGDLKEIEALGENSREQVAKTTTNFHNALQLFSGMDAPVIVAVNGSAAGAGLSLVLAGDYVLTVEKARFVSAYTAAGLTPDGSATYHLAKHVGLLRAKEMMFTNRALDAHEALAWGIVNKVVPREELERQTNKILRRFATGPTKAFGSLKRLLLSSYHLDIEKQMWHEANEISSMMETQDTLVGLYAFCNRKRPAYSGQ